MRAASLRSSLGSPAARRSTTSARRRRSETGSARKVVCCARRGEHCASAPRAWNSTLPVRSVVAIYPWTGRPGHPNPPNWDIIPGAHGSTPELEGFPDLFDEFAKRGIAIYGLSNQTTEYQREMAERLGLPFPILSDTEGRFAAALALPTFATG